MNVALVTNHEHALLTESDQLLIPAFSKVGIKAKPAIWNDSAVNWAEFDYVVPRSCWGYYRHIERFKTWLAEVEKQGPKLLNPRRLIEWNLDKKYIFDLQTNGVPIPKTTLVPKGDSRKLSEILDSLKTSVAVAKPCFGASAYGVMIIKADSLAGCEPEYRALVSKSDMLVQLFIPEIRNGEYSAVFIGGELSHVILKTPKAGEFRSNGERGGTEKLVTLDKALKSKVAEIFSKCGVSSLYARLDFVLVSSEPVLMELELIEPYLFFEFKEHSAELFVAKFRQYVDLPVTG